MGPFRSLGKEDKRRAEWGDSRKADSCYYGGVGAEGRGGGGLCAVQLRRDCETM